MRVQLAVSLSLAYDLFHHAGAAGDWRYSVPESESKADAKRGFAVLPAGGCLLQARRAAVRARGSGDGRGWCIHGAYGGPVWTAGAVARAQADRVDGVLRSGELYAHSRRRIKQGVSLLHRSPPLLRHGRNGDWGKEFGRDRGAGVVAERGAGHAGSPA